MDIAQSKRKENIAEYILYLWQFNSLIIYITSTNSIGK